MSPRFTDASVLPAFQTSAAKTRNGRQRLDAEVVALFDELRDPLLRYLARLGLALPDGEEVLQEVFLALFQHLVRGKSRENLRGWLFRVAHNLALKRRYRSRQVSLGRLDSDAADLAMEPGPNPEDRMLRSQTQERLLAVVRALPEQDRLCLFLRAEGLRYREIAGILEMSLGAVSLSLARSLARIARSAER
jgi:RNA polymerase sigma-70 factor, ECF subfamily